MSNEQYKDMYFFRKSSGWEIFFLVISMYTYSNMWKNFVHLRDILVCKYYQT